MSNPYLEESRGVAIDNIIHEWKKDYGVEPTQEEIEDELEYLCERYRG
jgi:FKBP-type peptidyl-prolyl cis-trans isomerase (trigger factor)